MFILLHGVGFGPETMTEVAAAIPGSRVVPRPSGPLADQVDAVAALVASTSDEPWVAAGVSGGATLALALALAGVPGLQRVVVHEPLVGRHAPSLWDAVAAGRAALAAGELSDEQWFAGTFGADHEPQLEPDLLGVIEPYVTWDPPTLLAPVPVRTTVGERSGVARHEAAAALAAAGAEVVVLPDCGHLAQLDAPKAFAEAALR